ncbi:MAG: H4MPT-linked C1 transfer pathway protein [Thermoprotei archaeon]|nr:MAG: H4MPT-linked C1 transfer pathway protein [Thermoprotei archaeon]RLF13669.1 MAG: H4MPT-linked C1 transfer pathway protein [Thermoprotei archaeon]
MNVNYLGLDVGGANLKAVLIELSKGIAKAYTRSLYLPLWKVGKEKLMEALNELASKAGELKAVGLTMTAELSDVYWCKREGVHHVLNTVERCFKDTEVKVVSVKGKLVSVEDAKKHPLEVAAANWAATGWVASKLEKTCVVVDVGSTTTSIVPVIEGELAVKGLNDLEKLMCGELVYTGALRTNVAAIVDKVPLRGGLIRVSSELFATSGDVHLILGHIREHEYTVDTADGREATRREALARLARVVCADLELISEEEVISMASFIYHRQLEAVAEGLLQVYSRLRTEKNITPPAYTAGIGAKFLAEPALRKIGVERVFSLSEVIGAASRMVPALGAGLMATGIEVDIKHLEVVEGWV